MADLSDDQRKALTDALDSIPSGTNVKHPLGWHAEATTVFWEILGYKYFIKGRAFDDALHSAKGAVADE